MATRFNVAKIALIYSFRKKSFIHSPVTSVIIFWPNKESSSIFSLNLVGLFEGSKILNFLAQDTYKSAYFCLIKIVTIRDIRQTVYTLYYNSACADGGPRSLSAHAAHVYKVTFKHLPKPLRSHM